ncbi:aKG-HExxH-type peptide beta-hydroxylase [Streptomyces sp. H39-S7]|uniref:aKG-HExxH-type peptide beta-hydroxylase n=1 Tax=Streptomyces sp. H39-S7 TaxID=3004357 RepID=UPI0022AFF864|nr:HEXXH motif-containing putative peptide modification protein [Streptomyces sp. H39-S7]MCZ4120032.1 HEXXH motif-containing putative peptide modification protein [Streptomyces sp. H39-S7]
MLVSDRYFGDSRAIEMRNLARFRVGLKLLASKEPHLGAALQAASALDDEAIRPLLYDPVLRNCFEDDIARMEHGQSPSGALADHLEHCLKDGPAGLGPCAQISNPRRKAWPAHGSAWIWGELQPQEPSDVRLAARLMELYRGSFEDAASSEPIVPTDEMSRSLGLGAELLNALLPKTGASVLSHVSVVGFTRGDSPEGPLQSLSGGDPLPSAILMAPERLRDSWVAAETLLHESAHLKLFDALRSAAVTITPNLLVEIPWRRSKWKLIRVIVALHFYTHFLLFQAAVDHAGDHLKEVFGEPSAADSVDEPSPDTPAAWDGTYRTTAERVRYLAETAISLSAELTPHGRRLVEWLLSVLQMAMTDPPRMPAAEYPGDSSGPAAQRVPAATEHETLYTRNEPVEAYALADLGQLVVGDPRTGRLHWLNAHSWVLYALCDGRSLESVESAYSEHVGTTMPPAEVREAVSQGITDLASSGLIQAGKRS